LRWKLIGLLVAGGVAELEWGGGRAQAERAEK